MVPSGILEGRWFREYNGTTTMCERMEAPIACACACTFISLAVCACVCGPLGISWSATYFRTWVSAGAIMGAYWKYGNHSNARTDAARSIAEHIRENGWTGFRQVAHIPGQSYLAVDITPVRERLPGSTWRLGRRDPTVD